MTPCRTVAAALHYRIRVFVGGVVKGVLCRSLGERTPQKALIPAVGLSGTAFSLRCT